MVGSAHPEVLQKTEDFRGPTKKAELSPLGPGWRETSRGCAQMSQPEVALITGNLRCFMSWSGLFLGVHQWEDHLEKDPKASADVGQPSAEDYCQAHEGHKWVWRVAPVTGHKISPPNATEGDGEEPAPEKDFEQKGFVLHWRRLTPQASSSDQLTASLS